MSKCVNVDLRAIFDFSFAFCLEQFAPNREKVNREWWNPVTQLWKSEAVFA